MSGPPQHPPPSPENLHRNRGLFSDHYLNETLPRRPDWTELAEEAGTVMEEVSEVFRSFVPSANEAQTEESLIRPVLRLLGHEAFEVQPSLSTPGGAKHPDYVFYRGGAAMAANKDTTLTEELLRSSGAFAVGDAKHWDRPLDVSDRRARDQRASERPALSWTRIRLVP